MNSYRSYVPIILFVLLMALSFFLIKPFLISLLLGALLAYVFFPFYRFLRMKTNWPSLSSILICLLVLVLLVVPAVFLLNSLVKESFALYVLVKQKLSLGLFSDCVNDFCTSVRGFVHTPEVNMQVQKLMKAVTNWVIERGSQLLVSVPGIMLNLFVMFFTLFYFLRDGEKLMYNLNDYLSLHQRRYVLLLGRLREIIRGIVFGYLVVAFIQGAVGALGFFLFGISSPLFWGVVMALLALIPYLGTGIIWAPAATFLFLEGVFQDSTVLMAKGIGLFAYGALLIASLDNVLKPKLMADTAKIHPAIVMIGIFGGLLMFGPLGVIIGPLVLSMTWVIIEMSVKKE